MQNQTFSDRYLVIKKLGEGSIGEVYLAQDINEKNKNVAIKILKNENISHRIDDIIRFQSEADTISKLFHTNIIKVYELREKENQHYIIMEYFDGKSLNNLLENNIINNHELIVDIIIKICEALDYIHCKNIIHRDIKPSNILIKLNEDNKTLKELKLIDFGLAQIKKIDQNNLNEMIGTLSYIAPEQTGLLRKQIDERSDLYSLGILFYQMLAKKLPFESTSLSSLIHQHIAKKPEQLRDFNKNIPNILEKIVLKLLEKEQDNRYQSAKGLLKDLIKFKNGLTDFILGFDDKVLKLHYRTRLVGREKEIEELKTILNNALDKKGSICLIKGEAGIGKSRLVEELKDYVSGKGRVFIEGKCFVGRNKIPYGPFKDSLNIYIRNFLYYSNIEKNGVREKLKEYLQELGEIILKLNPEMKVIIGEYPALVPLDPDKEHHRFITFLSQFFLKLSEIENGLVIFLDDLQWLDQGSFELLNEIIYDISRYPLLIIGTYRDNEITKEHSLVLFKDTAKKKQCPLIEISLDSFNQKKMDQFISNLLFDTEENIKEISSFVLQKSKGNPFFAMEILKQMITEKAVYQESNRWNIAQEILNKMEIFSSIVDILLKRISLLDEKEVTILSYAAVIGRKFDIEILFKLGKNFKFLSKGINKEIVIIIEKAKELQLLEEDLQIKGKILFVHDRIKEAFYQKIGDKKRKELHNTIGYVLEEINKNDIDGVIFDLAHHFVEGENIEKSIQYAFPAGMKAKETYAYDEAIKYLMITKALLEKKGIVKNDIIIKCIQAIGEIYLIIGKNNETIKLYEKLLPIINDKIDKAKAYVQIGNAYFKIWDYRNCELYIKMGFDLIGEKLPLKREEVILSIIKEFIIHIIHNLFPNIFIRKKENKNNVNKYKLILSFNYSLIWIYMFIDMLKFIRINLRSLNISESRIGISKEAGLYLSSYAGILVMIPLFNGAMKYYQKSLKIGEEFNDIWSIGHVNQLIGVSLLWKGEYKKSINYFIKSIDIMKRINDIKQISLTIHNLRYAYQYLGDYDNAIKINNEYYYLANRSNDNFGIISSILGNINIFYEKGDLIEVEKWILELQKIEEKYKINFLLFEEYFYIGLIALEKNEINKSIDYLEKSKDIYEKSNLMKQFTCYIYSFLAEAYLIKYENLFKDFKQKKEILKKIKKYSLLAIKNTKSWITHYSNALCVYAKYNSIINKTKKADKYFLNSINVASKIQKKYDLAKGYFEYGNFLNDIHKREKAFENWKKAYAIFKEIDSKIYLEKIKILLKIEDEKESPIQEFVKRLKNEQVSSNLLKLSQDIISSEDINQLLDKIMDVVLEMTGTQRGCIIIRDEQTNDMEILASKSMDKKEISFENFSLNIVYEALNTGETALTIDAMKDEKYSQYQSIIQYGIKSILCFPIIYKGETRGACYLDNQLSGVDFSQENIEKLNLIMTQIIISIENISLRKKNKKIMINEKYLSLKCKEFELTKRENEILLLVIKGFTNKEISNRSFISLNTVKTHLTNIYKKTDINERDELINVFTQFKIK